MVVDPSQCSSLKDFRIDRCTSESGRNSYRFKVCGASHRHEARSRLRSLFPERRSVTHPRTFVYVGKLAVGKDFALPEYRARVQL